MNGQISRTPIVAPQLAFFRKYTPRSAALIAALSLSSTLPLHADPPVLGGLVAHLDATNVDGSSNSTLTNGDSVGTWTNLRSTDNAAAVGGDGPTFQTGAVNGLPTLRFNGTNDVLRFSSLNQNQLIDATIFIVSNAASSASPGFALSADSGSSMRNNITTGNFATGSGWAYAQKISAPTNNSQFAVTGSRTIDFDHYRVIGARFDDPGVDDTGAFQELFLAGDTFTNQLTTPGTKITEASRLVQLGARESTSNLRDFFTGDISEVLIYDRAITDSERLQVERYLGEKYNTSISPGLKLYYSYDGPIGSNPTEVTDGGAGRSGSIDTNGTSSATIVDDRPTALASGQALELTHDATTADGARIQTANISDEINFNTDDWTFATWAKRDGDATKDWDFLFHIGTGNGFGGDDELYLYWANGGDTVKLEHFSSSGSALDVDLTVGTVLQDEWAHFVVVREGDELRVFLDGTEVASDDSFALAMNQNFNSRLTIGGVGADDSFNRSLDGSLDETAVWNRALSDFEIQSLATGGSAPLFTVVPEPSSSALLIALLSGFVVVRRRRR